MSLPAPQGPCAVGCIVQELLDQDRPAHLLATECGRRLFLKVWYPAEPGARGPGELVWPELRDPARAPPLARTVLGLLRQRTVSRSGARFAAPAAPSPLVIYHHGMVSFAAENTSLMEDLASHGYTVVAIEHRDQLAEFRGLAQNQSAAQRRTAAVLAKQIIRTDPAARAALAHDYYTASPNTNRIVRERAADTRLVLDRMESILDAIPGRHGNATSRPSVHLAGFSLGGAVATEVALHDARVASVVNLDGGTQGSIDAAALQVPYLMLYSQQNEGINDALLPTHAQRMAPAGTRHLNYHDIAGLVPLLRITPALGGIHPGKFLRHRNEMVRRFLGQLKPARNSSTASLTAAGE
jgi:dienelactone hydrolase